MKHKERLKQLKLETDVLTLTATPIPRTLHQSLAGLRDMTVIADAAARSLARAHLRRAVGRGVDRGGNRARARSRRSGLLRSQPHRDHRRHRGPHPAPRAARARDRRARADARARSRRGDAEVRRRRGRRARVDDDRRVGAGRAEREHDVRESRRPLRARAALPAPRPRRALVPARLLLPARPRCRGHRCGAPALGARASHRARIRIQNRAEGSRVSRRRQSARLRAVGVRPGGGIRALSQDARRDGQSAW